jgi:hypothetical protein
MGFTLRGDGTVVGDPTSVFWAMVKLQKASEREMNRRRAKPAQAGRSTRAAKRRKRLDKKLEAEVARRIRVRGQSDTAIAAQLSRPGKTVTRVTVRRIREGLGLTPEDVRRISADL